MSAYDNGTFCGDKRFTLTWLLVQLVYAAAWLSDPMRRKDS